MYLTLRQTGKIHDQLKQKYTSRKKKKKKVELTNAYGTANLLILLLTKPRLFR